MVHFFGAHVTEAKPLTVTVPEGFVLNVVHASLASGPDAVLSVETTSLDQSLVKVVVGTLRSGTCDQIKLDLVLGAHKAKFSLQGHGVVDLSGYFQPGPPEDSTDEDDISRLSVDDLSALIQQAASRISKHNADELEGSDDEQVAAPIKSPSTAALPSKKRPRADAAAVKPLASTSAKQAHEPSSDDDGEDEDPNESTAAAPKNLVTPLHHKPEAASAHSDHLKKRNKKKKRKNYKPDVSSN
ncbi:hypothetical protein DYB28_007917 [Aphanomyces astaci]|uniref:Nucleoplasmin-like domain-containing protein n=1 Tax=Aphanomyces astaci TaxID=112090 RepID=A0A397AAF8_APHAT|nr:hypothetical protein DYB36_009352 [Aphanomyces astaci]RHY17840.1 hypothetical protein DYB25_001170 [Aphanomyces astaci]RHY76504.1 hypothetical protein DYB38_010234 [Aphanomyces astaci]RHY85014.1 hypothetical protein DYB26_010240 [Aphanomyces astaci]RHZ16930.1 hypothetical protein DYB31_008717 [Aphanomyces astaci]